MPTYDYRCESCGHEFEHFQSMKSPVLRKCPECGTLKLRRLIGTGGGLIFKGSGFYITDYRSDSYQKDQSSDSKESSGSSSDQGDKGSSGDTKKSGGSGSKGAAAKKGSSGKKPSSD